MPAGATAAVFGFGWFVLAVAGVSLVGGLTVRRLGAAWVLLSVAALTVPAVATAGLRLTPTTGERVVRVASAAALDAHTYHSGFDTLLLDLRQTPLPRTGRRTLHIQAGVRRTIVALPAGRCVHVVVRQDIDPFPARVASLLTGDKEDAFSSVFLFGRLYGGPTVRDIRTPRVGRGPTLTVDFHSMGGSLYVRDYPDRVAPEVAPDWPGYPVFVEKRPDTRGLKRRSARREILAWRGRRRRERPARARYSQLVPGPCGAR